MAIIYDKAAKRDTINKKVKWYASARTIKLVDEKEVARLIADETTLNPMEALMVLAQLEKVVLALLMNGYSVRIGDWASFYATLASRGVDSPEEVAAGLVKSVRANCRFSPSFRRKLNKAEFVSAEKFKG